ncbi:MAG: helix-hairpin-helix domain-containing protein [Myxococcota bacterium]
MRTALLFLASLWAGVALASQPVLLNEAGVDELAAIEGVGPDIAREVVELRTKRGRLGSVEELRILPGIPDATLDTLRKNTTVQVELPMGPVRRYDSPQQVLAEFSGEPSVQQVQAWANDYANMSPRTVEKWLKASKTFAALPTVWLRYRLTDDWDQDFQYYALDGLVDEEGEALFNVLDDAGRQQEAQYFIQARWDLEELVMSSNRIRILNEAQDIVKLRDKILTEVNRVYFERRRVQAEMLLAPKGDVLGQVKDELRVMELTANLDAMTGGRFTAALARSGQ